ncbi:Autophagy-related protein 9A [Bienertia sinuspersici]
MYGGDEDGYNGGPSESSSGAASPYPLRRASSYPMQEDVDNQAEMFIENFYKHLVYEKQVSLNLRYCRDTSSSTFTDDSTVSSLSSAGSQLVSPT